MPQHAIGALPTVLGVPSLATNFVYQKKKINIGVLIWLKEYIIYRTDLKIFKTWCCFRKFRRNQTIWYPLDFYEMIEIFFQ